MKKSVLTAAMAAAIAAAAMAAVRTDFFIEALPEVEIVR